jgi:phage portal protein BeeE
MLANLFRRSGDFPISGINNPNTPIYQALAGLEMGGYGPATSGANVNAQTAMRVVTVHRCVTLIAQTIATLPLGVYRDEASGRKELTNPASPSSGGARTPR